MNNYTSRRGFLQSGAASFAAGAFTIVAPETVRGTQASSRISVGLIGCGGRGSFDASVIHRDDARAQVTALCDIFPDRFEPAQATIKVDNPKTFSDYQKLLADPGIDAVVIATPPFEHPRMFEAAAQAKKHIYLEKPTGVDVAGCQRVLAASKKADPSKTIAVGFQARYAPHYVEGYKRLKAGEIGEVATARGGTMMQNLYARRKPYSDPKEDKLRNWQAWRDLSGDFIVEQDCHNLDVLQWFLGDHPVSAIGYGSKKVRRDFDIWDNMSLAYRWPNDLIVNFECNQISTGGFLRAGEDFTGTAGFIALTRTDLTLQKSPKEVVKMKPPREISLDALQNFLDRIVNKDPENAIERAARSTLIGILGREAAYTGREATWKGVIGFEI